MVQALASANLPRSRLFHGRTLRLPDCSNPGFRNFTAASVDCGSTVDSLWTCGLTVVCVDPDFTLDSLTSLHMDSSLRMDSVTPLHMDSVTLLHMDSVTSLHMDSATPLHMDSVTSRGLRLHCSGANLLSYKTASRKRLKENQHPSGHAAYMQVRVRPSSLFTKL